MKTEELELAYKEAKNSRGFENKNTDTEYRITVDEENKTITVSFQGSGSKLDWKQNFSFWKKPYRKMKHLFFVHSGLFNKYKSVKDSIWSYIYLHLESDWKIRSYGFSQGATLATFFHEDAVYRIPKLDIESYAFAPAKGFSFFNARFLKSRFENLYTVININDVVPKLPFLWMGFKHFGSKVKLGKKKFLVLPWNYEKEHLSYKELF